MSEKLEKLGALWAKNREQAQSSSTNLVYSTQVPNVGDSSAQALGKKALQPNIIRSSASSLSSNQGSSIRVRRETKGRGGKAVTVISGLTFAEAQIVALGKELKTLCGSGGTVKDGVIEVQGDHVDRIVLALNAKGFQAKRSGG